MVVGIFFWFLESYSNGEKKRLECEWALDLESSHGTFQISDFKDGLCNWLTAIKLTVNRSNMAFIIAVSVETI